MPRLACFICGRTVWATVALAQLFAEERRCPRCGANLHDDRRSIDRRAYLRRQGPSEASIVEFERRVAERRSGAGRRRI